jgi:hypothetical protein
MDPTKAIPLEQFATSLGVASDQLKPLKAQLKRGKHWIVGRYNKTYLTAAGQDRLKELVATSVEQEANIEPVSEPETPPEADAAPSEVQESSWAEASQAITEALEQHGIEPDAPKTGSALGRLLAESETATVLRTRFTNNRVLLVSFKGEDRICLCKDSRYFVPGMVIPVRPDGDNLVAKFQPRRLGKF